MIKDTSNRNLLEFAMSPSNSTNPFYLSISTVVSNILYITIYNVLYYSYSTITMVQCPIILLKYNCDSSYSNNVIFSMETKPSYMLII